MVNGRTAPRSVICAQRTRRPAGRCHGLTERLPATIAREERPARRRQSEVPDPALDRDPQPRLSHPRPHPPAPASGLGRALQHNARAHRDLRRDAPLHRRRLQGLRMDPCRRHQKARALRSGQAVRQTPQRHLAPAPSFDRHISLSGPSRRYPSLPPVRLASRRHPAGADSQPFLFEFDTEALGSEPSNAS